RLAGDHATESGDCRGDIDLRRGDIDFRGGRDLNFPGGRADGNAARVDLDRRLFRIREFDRLIRIAHFAGEAARSAELDRGLRSAAFLDDGDTGATLASDGPAIDGIACAAQSLGRRVAAVP